MPKQMPADTDMDSLYSGGEEQGPGEQEESIDQENAENMAEQSEVPLKVLQGSPGEEVKPGDEIVVQVVSVHGDSALIRYAPKKEAKPGEGEEEPAGKGEMSPDEELDSLDTY